MKAVRLLGVFAILCLISPLASDAQERGRSRRGEILVNNDTDSQITFFITTERHGRQYWTYKPGSNSYVGVGPDGARLRVSGDDVIEIADWGKVDIQDVAQFRDGVWKLSIRRARRDMPRR